MPIYPKWGRNSMIYSNQESSGDIHEATFLITLVCIIFKKEERKNNRKRNSLKLFLLLDTFKASSENVVGYIVALGFLGVWLRSSPSRLKHRTPQYTSNVDTQVADVVMTFIASCCLIGALLNHTPEYQCMEQPNLYSKTLF